MVGDEKPSFIESLFGWIYFVAWGLAAYPQLCLIFRHGTTAGLSSDLVIINTTGFISYAVFTFSSYSVAAVSSAYLLHTGFPPQINFSDVTFAAHGVCISSMVCLQKLYFPPRTPPRRFITVICVLCLTSVFIALGLCFSGYFDWYIYLLFIGMLKVLASLFKLIPQVLLNHSRQSTFGWSIYSICLDMIGGTFSIAQQLVRCFRVKSLAPYTSNYAKTFLAAESLMFDVYFVWQHLMFQPSEREQRKDAEQTITPHADICTKLLPSV